jgi:hypothetical protein
MEVSKIGRRRGAPRSALASLVLVLGISSGALATVTMAHIAVLDGRPSSPASTPDTNASIGCGQAIALRAAVALDPDGAAAICADGGHFDIALTQGRGLTYMGGLVPEASTWAIVMAGFAVVGAFLRGRRRARRGSSSS